MARSEAAWTRHASCPLGAQRLPDRAASKGRIFWYGPRAAQALRQITHRDDVLMPAIQRVSQANMQVYGADKVWRQLGHVRAPRERAARRTTR